MCSNRDTVLFITEDLGTINISHSYSLLQTTLRTRKKREWKGRLVLQNHTYELEIFDVITQESTATIYKSIRNVKQLQNNNFILCARRNEFIICDHNFKEIVTIPNETQNAMFLELRNGDIFIASEFGIWILPYRSYTLVKKSNYHVADATQLSNGRIALLHSQQSIILWDERYNKLMEVACTTLLNRIMELESGVLLAVGKVFTSWDTNSNTLTHHKESETIFDAIRLTNGLIAIDDAYVSVYDRDNKILETKATKFSGWRGAMVEIANGILAFQSRDKILVWDIEKGEEICWYGIPNACHVRCFVFE